MCEKVDYLQVIGEFDSALRLIAELDATEADLIFLDIHLPDLNGIELLKNVKSLPQVIFITADDSFAVDAFALNATDYLVKPLSLPRFMQAVNKAKGQLLGTKKSANSGEIEEFYIKVDRRLIKLHVNDIMWVEAKGDYVKFITEDDAYIIHSTLKKVENILPKSLFLRVHRSYIVNLSKVKDIEDSSLLINEKLIPVSRANYSHLMENINLI